MELTVFNMSIQMT